AGLWTVFTLGGVGSKPTPQLEQCSPLANQRVLVDLMGEDNLSFLAQLKFHETLVRFMTISDSSAFSSSNPHTFQINFNSLYTALCEQQKSDQATLLLYMLLHQNGNVRTYVLARTDIENLV
ncbi:DYM protein, partial [Anseranas semipalmata]|nr:DYM protein [Anseranas semipalmata]